MRETVEPILTGLPDELRADSGVESAKNRPARKPRSDKGKPKAPKVAPRSTEVILALIEERLDVLERYVTVEIGDGNDGSIDRLRELVAELRRAVTP